MLARRWHGVVTTRQLVAAGIGADAIRHRVKHGWLLRLHRGVYQVGPVAARYGREMAALLATGPGAALSTRGRNYDAFRRARPAPAGTRHPVACHQHAFGCRAPAGTTRTPPDYAPYFRPRVLSHHSAAAVWGFRPAHEGDVHVTVLRGRGAPRPGIRVHRSASLQAAVRAGLRLTTPARTLLDLATDLPPDDLERAVEQAIVLKLTTETELAAHCEHGNRGAARLRRALLIEPGLTRSKAERQLRRLIRSAQLPRPVTNVRVAGWEVDLLWREQRLVVEVDGFAFHGSRHAFERDRRRDADLVAAGYRVVRFTWRQIKYEPAAVIARLAVLLHARAAIAA